MTWTLSRHQKSLSDAEVECMSAVAETFTISKTETVTGEVLAQPDEELVVEESLILLTRPSLEFLPDYFLTKKKTKF